MNPRRKILNITRSLETNLLEFVSSNFEEKHNLEKDSIFPKMQFQIQIQHPNL